MDLGSERGHCHGKGADSRRSIDLGGKGPIPTEPWEKVWPVGRT